MVVLELFNFGMYIVMLSGDYCVQMVLFREVYRQTFRDKCFPKKVYR